MYREKQDYDDLRFEDYLDRPNDCPYVHVTGSYCPDCGEENKIDDEVLVEGLDTVIELLGNLVYEEGLASSWKARYEQAFYTLTSLRDGTV